MRPGHGALLIDVQQKRSRLVACELTLLRPPPDLTLVSILGVEGPGFPHLEPPHELGHFLPHQPKAPPNHVHGLTIPIQVLLMLNLGTGPRASVKLRLSLITERSPSSKFALPLRFALWLSRSFAFPLVWSCFVLLAQIGLSKNLENPQKTRRRSKK